jgi:hypothetical protein
MGLEALRIRSALRHSPVMAGESGPQDDGMIGDPVPEVFRPDDPTARFVVSMAMARNDIDRALRDLVRAVEEDGPDFAYRVRLLTGHYVEAIDALNLYRQTFPEVQRLVRQVPADRRKQLVIATSALGKGRKALHHVRHNTFHYPSPNDQYSPTSDQKLAKVLTAMTGCGVSALFDGDTEALTMTFADDAALDLAMGKPTVTNAEVQRRAAQARDGALAFHKWFDALLTTYMDANDQSYGEPHITEKRRRP